MDIKSSLIDVLEHALKWRDEDHAVDLVTVVRTFGSAPRPVGTMAAVRHDGLLIGSVSGGCIEKQLVESIRKQGLSTSVVYRVTDAEAKRFGLMCGGEIELVFEPISERSQLHPLLARLLAGQQTTRRLDISTGTVELTDRVETDQFHMDGKTVTNPLGPNHRLILIGSNELARFTAQFASALDFEIRVCDPRKEFRATWTLNGITPIDLMPDDAVKRYATHANCAVLTLTHDPNLDDLALIESCERKLFYVGALGSSRSHEKRLHRLRGLDISEPVLKSIKAPIGLSIGSRTSAEIAVSIVAELVQARSMS